MQKNDSIMRKRCVFPSCRSDKLSKHHYIEGKVDWDRNDIPAKRTAFLCRNRHHDLLNRKMKQFKKDSDQFPDDYVDWHDYCAIDDIVFEGRRKVLTSTESTFCQTGTNLLIMSIDSIREIVVSRDSNHTNFNIFDNKKRVAYVLRARM